MKRPAVLLMIASLAAGCGTQSPPEHARPAERASPPPPATVAKKPAPPTCDPGRTLPVSGGGKSFVAVARAHVTAFRRIEGPVAARFGPRNVNGVPTVFAVEALTQTRGCRPAWYRVELPMRPNGAKGWVRASTVQLLWLDTRIVIRVKAMRLELVRRGRVVLRAPIAPGAPDTPTPVGRFYVTQRLVPKDPNGPWGPAALGTSAFSPVLKDWAQGGPIGIHGTNEPWAIGHAVSHGCIRLPNDAMRTLFRLTPAGTPVVIVR